MLRVDIRPLHSSSHLFKVSESGIVQGKRHGPVLTVPRACMQRLDRPVIIQEAMAQTIEPSGRAPYGGSVCLFSYRNTGGTASIPVQTTSARDPVTRTATQLRGS